MATDRSDKAYDYWRDASLRFDYFVTGGTGALAAYVGQTLKPQRIGLNPETLELIALAILVSSVAVGLKRIEEGVEIFKRMHRRTYHDEARGALVAAAVEGSPVMNKATGDFLSPGQMHLKAEEHRLAGEKDAERLETMIVASARYYRWRNRLLLMGFVLLVAARIMPAYIQR